MSVNSWLSKIVVRPFPLKGRSIKGKSRLRESKSFHEIKKVRFWAVYETCAFPGKWKMEMGEKCLILQNFRNIVVNRVDMADLYGRGPY